jgi:hypothetical protein
LPLLIVQLVSCLENPIRLRFSVSDNWIQTQSGFASRQTDLEICS